MHSALELSSSHLVGVGWLAGQTKGAYFPLPKPFGLHMRSGAKVPAILRGCTVDARLDFASTGSGTAVVADHCSYAVQNEFPWLPFLAALKREPALKAQLAEAIQMLVCMDCKMANRWWFTYEAILGEQLPMLDAMRPPTGADASRALARLVPLLPPDRFFTTSGQPSWRHGVLDNLLGDAASFCPFVERFAGSSDAASEFQAELFEVLSPICMMTVKEFLEQVGLHDGSEVTLEKFSALIDRLDEDGFRMSKDEREELKGALSLDRPRNAEGKQVPTTFVVEFATWLRGSGTLACRLREHLLDASPTDLRWHAPGEQFMDRLSRVISSIETRASQMIEGELPPERKQRYMVDVLSSPWERDIDIDADLICRLQRGLLVPDKYDKVVETQVEGEPRRQNQNWVSSEKYDDMVGKTKVCHHLPPPPQCLPELLDGYFKCLNRLLNDPTVDPIVCATIAKVAFNVMHPLVDGNGRVQRVLFQLVLFKRGYLPRMNVPVSVIMLQDRSGYELLQQRHVDQTMAGVEFSQGKSDEIEEGGDDFQHTNATEGISALYQYQDFTFATSAMIKLMQGTLPVIAAKAYFLQRFDWRVDELLKGDALLPARAATKIAKVFKNDGHGLSMFKLAKLLFIDGWQLGFKRVLRFLAIAKHPSDIFGTQRIMQRLKLELARSRRKYWVMHSGQFTSASSTARVRWVGVSLSKFHASKLALKRALAVSQPGDTVMAVHYPKDMNSHFSMDLFPDLAPSIHQEMQNVRNEVLEKVESIVAESGVTERGVLFRAFVGAASAYKPAYALCEDARVAEAKPYRIYVGYDQDEHHRTFTDYVIRNAPCDVAIIKGEPSKNVVRWVGISERNFEISGSALAKAFHHSQPGDTVVAVHYPINPFHGEGLSSVYCEHFASLSSLAEHHVDTIVDNVNVRVMERAQRIADGIQKEGVIFRTIIGERTQAPHLRLCMDAVTSELRPNTIYVGYNRRRDRKRLVDPHKLYDVAEYVVRNAPCNVMLIKETHEQMSQRVKEMKEMRRRSMD